MPDLQTTLDATEQHLRANGYRGYDPYDGLESPLFRLPGLRRTKLLRWGFQQVLKRIPFQTRPLFGIRPGYNPVTLALVLQALTYRDQAAGDAATRRETCVHLVSELERLQTRGYSGACWGYDFDWEARYARIPAWHPTVVATGFVTNALFAAWRHFGLSAARDLVLAAVPFVREDLQRTHEGDTFCWSYSPTDRQSVLNATMKGARLLAQAVVAGGDPTWFEEAHATIGYVVARQRADGSWPYSVGDTRSWADHFHTCYNIDCLDEYQRLSGDQSFSESLQRGVDYYRQHFFAPGGVPKYYDQQLYPIDATCCGQALLTLLRFGDLDQARETADWILDHMVLPKGRFKYQIHRRYENRLEYVRWSTGWLFAGLSRLELESSRKDMTT